MRFAGTDAVHLSEADRWRCTLDALRKFIEQNLVPDKKGSFPIATLASCWAARHVRPRMSGDVGVDGTRINYPEIVQRLHDSGLFLSDSVEFDNEPKWLGEAAIAGAISAYLDGFFLANGNVKSPRWAAVFNAIIDDARSSRRFAGEPSVRQLTGWLALLIAVCAAPAETADCIHDRVAERDMAIAFDLYAIRGQLCGPDRSRQNIVGRVLDHAFRHRNAISTLFRWGSMDAYQPPTSPPIATAPDVDEPMKIITVTNDLDVLVTMLTSCAILTDGDERRFSFEYLWKKVTPPAIVAKLRDLGLRLQDQAAGVEGGARVGIRPVSLVDLIPIFPGIARYHARERNRHSCRGYRR